MSKKPFGAEISSIVLVSFNGNHSIDLKPQMIEMVFYESVFAPLLKAELLINDEIGLFVNFPLTGEEFIHITYKPTGEENEVPISTSFVINAVTKIAATNNARGQAYALNLVSRLAYENSKLKVSHAYSGTISSAAKSLFNNYLASPAQKLNSYRRTLNNTTFPVEKFYFTDIEESLDSRTIVIPNLRAIDALQWLAKRAVSSDFKTNYLYTFYETISGFHFKTIQSNFTNTNKKKAFRNPYFYVSNIENIDDSLDPRNSITNLHIDKRYSTLDKIVNGYFENEYFEINLYENAWKTNPSRITNEETKIDVGKLNTLEYQQAAWSENSNLYTIQQNSESYNRIKYAFNNAPEFEETQPLFEFRNKWGSAIRSTVALDQINMTITVEGNTNIEAGQLIYCLIPEMHGFNKINKDELISGYYLVSDVKQVFSVGNRHTTVMRINKDSYGTELEKMEFKY